MQPDYLLRQVCPQLTRSCAYFLNERVTPVDEGDRVLEVVATQEIVPATIGKRLELCSSPLPAPKAPGSCRLRPRRREDPLAQQPHRERSHACVAHAQPVDHDKQLVHLCVCLRQGHNPRMQRLELQATHLAERVRPDRRQIVIPGKLSHERGRRPRRRQTPRLATDDSRRDEAQRMHEQLLAGTHIHTAPAGIEDPHDRQSLERALHSGRRLYSEDIRIEDPGLSRPRADRGPQRTSTGALYAETYAPPECSPKTQKA